MPEAGDTFYATMLSLNAVLLLVIAIERRARDDTRSSAWIEWSVGQILVLGIYASLSALAFGGGAVSMIVVLLSTLIGLAALQVAITVLTVSPLNPSRRRPRALKLAWVVPIAPLAFVAGFAARHFSH